MKKDRVKNSFLEELRKIPVVQVACERCGISRQSVYRWRKEDGEFRTLMDNALNEGESLVNDMCESKLLTLIKEGKFPAIRFWLGKRHPKFKDKNKDEISRVHNKIDSNKVIAELGLVAEDFKEENTDKTIVRIYNHLYGR